MPSIEFGLCMAKLSQGFYLTFFSTAKLLLCKVKPLWGRQMDNAGADVFLPSGSWHTARENASFGAASVKIQIPMMGTFMTPAAQEELAPHKRGKWAHISPACHLCNCGARSQLGWPQNRWARETASQSGPTVGQIFMWAVKVQIATLWAVVAEVCGSAKKSKQNLSLHIRRTFPFPPFNLQAHFSFYFHFPHLPANLLPLQPSPHALRHQRPSCGARGEETAWVWRGRDAGLLLWSAYDVVDSLCVGSLG